MKFFYNSQGFSLLEVVLVVSLLVIMLSIAVPYGLRFFTIERLDSTSRELLEVLRLAQAQAAHQKLDSSFGVYIGQNGFTLFQGNSYASRNVDYDLTYQYSTHVTIEGMTEVVFDQMTGLPQEPGEIIMTSGSRANIIQVNNQGMVSLSLNVSLASP
jgi:prepilin-type N-terminal cleavage/methylation domain-containing protein